MRIVVLGAGLIGVLTAYYLAKDGHEVVVVDRQDDVGLETSFANGALITPSTSDSWAAPGTPQKLLKWLGREDAPLLLRPSRQAWHRFLAWETGGVALDEDWARLTALGTEQRWGKTVDPRPPAERRLRACRVPMLVVTAARSRAHDPVAVGERAEALLPRARTHVLPTATHHTVPLAHADELDPLILDFLA